MANPFQNKSDSYWTEGVACADVGCWNSAAHILYYAVFQAVYGYAEMNGSLQKYLEPVWDATLGIRRKPTKHEAARKIVDHWKGARNAQSRAFKKLYAARIKADYKTDDVADYEVSAYISDAKALREYFINLKPPLGNRGML